MQPAPKTKKIGVALAVGAWVSSSLLAPSEIVINEIMYLPRVASSSILEDTDAEFIELTNTGDSPVDLSGWSLTGGIELSFVDSVVPPSGFVVACANPAALLALQDTVFETAGPWTGKLSNSAETLRLIAPSGEVVDEVSYADSGAWAVRERGPLDLNHRGWVWAAAHDGEGNSLELLNPSADNRHGQLWAPSPAIGGSPGFANGNRIDHVPPITSDPLHEPTIPTSTDEIAVSALVTPGTYTPLATTLHFRRDGDSVFSQLPMFDNGQGNDSIEGDRRLTATLPSQPHGSVIEYFVTSCDIKGHTRRLPQKVGTEGANFLFQVLDHLPNLTTTCPHHLIVMTEIERTELATIGSVREESRTNAKMNATVISTWRGETTCRYNVGVRNRGNTSRWMQPNSYRLFFRTDKPWNGLRSVTFLGRYPHRSITGYRLHQLAGLPASDAIPATLAINGTDLTMPGDPSHMRYAQVEVFDSEFADNHFPHDSNGNLYSVNFDGLLDFPSLAHYRSRYNKQTNRSLYDFTDLQSLTDALNNTPDEDYIAALETSIDIDQWLRFIALNVLVGNRETSLSRGDENDFALYRGALDQRFQLLPKDMDSVTVGDASSVDLFEATAHPTIARFLNHPEIAPRYFWQLRDLANTVLSAPRVDLTMESLLDSFVPAAELQEIKDYLHDRRAAVLAAIPSTFTIFSTLPVVEGVHQSTTPTTTITGTSDGETRTVLVGGMPVTLDPTTGAWSATETTLHPGENRVLVQYFGEDEQEMHRDSILIRWENGVRVPLPANITTELNLTAAEGPYLVTGANTVVRAGGRLLIEAGTTIYFDDNRTLLMSGGTLLANGSATAKIQMTRNPGVSSGWIGLGFTNNASGNRVTHTDLRYGGNGTNNRNVTISHSEVEFDHVSWSETNARIFFINRPNLVIRNCTFPTLVGQQHIAGYGGLIDGDNFLIEGNIFGSTTGYSDIIDWSGGQRPGPILQIIGNIFLGGSDEALDLDGTDAHIEGNTFLNISKDNGSTSTANAIATGSKDGISSDLTIVRNLFVNCDHALLLKNGSRATFENNTVIGSAESAINFGEPERGVPYGEGAIVRSSIFSDNALDFENVIASVDLVVQNSRVSAPWQLLGTGNIIDPPLFEGVSIASYPLADGSPCRGTGFQGIDMGANVGPGPRPMGLPIGETGSTSLDLMVSGPGLDMYRYSLDEEPFSAEIPISAPISLTNLSQGAHQIRLVGRNSAGVWQHVDDAYQSPQWNILPAGGRIRISEILASNQTTLNDDGSFPDVVELENHGSAVIDLTGYALTDDLSEPSKFLFPPLSLLSPSEYFLALGGTGEQAGTAYLGFGLNNAGESLFLIDPTGEIVDSVHFGIQAPDLSIGLTADGQWSLCKPTLGARNQSATVGSPELITINEWASTPSTILGGDFVEVFNPSPYPVSMGGCLLSSLSENAPSEQEIAPLSYIAPNGHIAFSRDSSPELKFGLRSEQGIITLRQPTGELIDQILHHSQLPDSSTGRSSDGASEFSHFAIPTPGSSNQFPHAPAVPRLLEGLRITELHYHPVDTEDLEYIELRNLSPLPLHLEGVRFVEGITFTFPDVELLSGERIVLAKDPLKFSQKHGSSANVVGPYSGKLSNGGERLTMYLSAPNDLAIQRFEFKDDWWPATDGGGHTLQISDPAMPAENWSKREGWRPSKMIEGSPGKSVLWCNIEHDGQLDWPASTLIAAIPTDEGFLPFPETVSFAWTTAAGPTSLGFTSSDSSTTTVVGSPPGRYVAAVVASTESGETALAQVELQVIGGYEEWRLAHFTSAQLQNPELSGELADPDADGIGNFEEYAFGSSPLHTSRPALEVLPSEQLQLSFVRPPNRDDVVYEFQRSGDLTNWTSFTEVKVVNITNLVDGRERVTLKASGDGGVTDLTFFFRISIHHSAPH